MIVVEAMPGALKLTVRSFVALSNVAASTCTLVALEYFVPAVSA
jgi:hypothetical protein